MTKPALSPPFWLLMAVLLLVLILAACSSAPTQAPQPVVTQPVTPTSQPILPAVTATPYVEARVVELEWPASLRLGDSDIIRLSLAPSKDGYSAITEFPEHQVQTQTMPLKRPGGYDLWGVARLDGIGFDITPVGDQARYLSPGEPIAWRWSLTPHQPGQQRLSVALLLRWIPVEGVAGTTKESLAFSRSLDVRVRSFFGLTQGQAMRGSLAGVLFGGGLCLFAFLSLKRPANPSFQPYHPNPAMVIEPSPGLQLTGDEQSLLRSLFHRYNRLILKSEFLSGYSGARTFLAQPVQASGRADAATIVKISSQEAIRREYQNYESFVKDTLPPITARIQHAPVVLPPMKMKNRPVVIQQDAALQYTFIAEPGRPPLSLRQALLAHPDPVYLTTLFNIFGPNWWMQRAPYVFSLAQEYDRMLPAHLVLEPTSGKGKILEGTSSPSALSFQAGDCINLRHFQHIERRVDGHSLALTGEAPPGQPALRVRWRSLSDPLRTAGRVVATRTMLLQDLVHGFEHEGLPDPLEKLISLFNESINGTRSIIHGDLNLENILVGPGELVWLIDFAQTREGHTLFDFAHLEAEIIAHIVAPQVSEVGEYLALLDQLSFPASATATSTFPHISRSETSLSAICSLLSMLHSLALQCLFNPSCPREFELSLYAACVGALKFANLDAWSRQLLYLRAAHLVHSL